MQYLTLTDTSSDYHNHNYIKIIFNQFVCRFGTYIHTRLPFSMAPARDMLRRKVDEICKDMPNISGIADDTVIIGHDKNGCKHDTMLKSVIKICQNENIKIKSNVISGIQRLHFFTEIISRLGVLPDPQKLHALMEMSPSKNKKRFAIISWHNEITENFTSNCRDM